MAEMYTYRDETGTLHAVFSAEEIPTQYREIAKKHVREESPQSKDTNPLEVRLILKKRGNTLLLPVRVGDAGEFVFVLDTGAGMTMINNRIAKKFGTRVGGQAKSAGIGGTISVKLVRVSEIAVESLVVRNMLVSAADVPVIESLGADGILGVDFLNHFRMQLDTKTGELILQKK